MTWLGAFLIAGFLLLVWRLDPSLRGDRKYRAALKARSPLSDREMYLRYFAEAAVSLDVPGRVRGLFAKHMQLDAERMLPDDDLNFFWADLDMVDFQRELESEFAIVVSDSEAEKTHCTVREVAMLVGSKQGTVS